MIIAQAPLSNAGNLFTIVSLVIAVSGGIYAAFIAMRSLFEQEISTAIDSREMRLKAISEGSETVQATKDGAEEESSKMIKYHKWWRNSFLVPVVLFVVLSYVMAIHAVCLGQDVVVSGTWWIIYKFLMVAVLITDLTCVIVA